MPLANKLVVWRDHKRLQPNTRLIARCRLSGFAFTCKLGIHA